jgi:hypothetical protein
MRQPGRVFPTFVVGWALLVMMGGGGASFAQGLSAGATQALRDPPEQMSPALHRELSGFWEERARDFLGRLLSPGTDAIESELWIDRLAERPYLHFKASGMNRDYATNPRRNVVIVLFVGPTRETIDREFGDWFAPYEGGDEFIRPIDFGAERAAHSNVTEDGTESIYWQQGNAFLEVRSRTDVMALAQETHTAALRSGIYDFPRVPRDRTPEPVEYETPEAPAADAPAAAAPEPEEAGEDDAGGWRRVEAEIIPDETPEPSPEEMFEAAAEEPAAASVPAPTPEVAVNRPPSPRIPAATLGLALHAALRRDEAAPVAALIGAGAEIEARDSGGRTPLITAAEHSSPALVQRLIDSGADTNAVREAPELPPSESGMTALMVAALMGREEVVRLLLDAGARVDATTGDGRTAIDFAMESGSEAVSRILTGARTEARERTETPVAPGQGEGEPKPAGVGSIRAGGPGDPSAGEGSGGPIRAVDAAMLASGVGTLRVWQARLELAWNRLEVDLNEDRHATVLRAVILEWDGRVRPESTGVLAYEYWRTALARLSPENPLTAAAPSPSLGDAKVIEALRIAAKELMRDFGTVEARYERRNG